MPDIMRGTWSPFSHWLFKNCISESPAGLVKTQGSDPPTSGISDSVGVTGRHHNSLPSWYSCSCVPGVRTDLIDWLLKNGIWERDGVPFLPWSFKMLWILSLSLALSYISSWWKTLLCHESSPRMRSIWQVCLDFWHTEARDTLDFFSC